MRPASGFAALTHRSARYSRPPEEMAARQRSIQGRDRACAQLQSPPAAARQATQETTTNNPSGTAEGALSTLQRSGNHQFPDPKLHHYRDTGRAAQRDSVGLLRTYA